MARGAGEFAAAGKANAVFGNRAGGLGQRVDAVDLVEVVQVQRAAQVGFGHVGFKDFAQRIFFLYGLRENTVGRGGVGGGAVGRDATEDALAVVAGHAQAHMARAVGLEPMLDQLRADEFAHERRGQRGDVGAPDLFFHFSRDQFCGPLREAGLPLERRHDVCAVPMRQLVAAAAYKERAAAVAAQCGARLLGLLQLVQQRAPVAFAQAADARAPVAVARIGQGGARLRHLNENALHGIAHLVGVGRLVVQALGQVDGHGGREIAGEGGVGFPHTFGGAQNGIGDFLLRERFGAAIPLDDGGERLGLRNTGQRQRKLRVVVALGAGVVLGRHLCVWVVHAGQRVFCTAGLAVRQRTVCGACR